MHGIGGRIDINSRYDVPVIHHIDRQRLHLFLKGTVPAVGFTGKKLTIALQQGFKQGIPLIAVQVFAFRFRRIFVRVRFIGHLFRHLQSDQCTV